MKNLNDISVMNKRVLVRCDFNVPVDKKGKIQDDYRIKKALPTIKYLLENKAKIILMSHLGDPKGQVVPELTLDNVAERLATLLDMPIAKENDCIGPDVETESNNLEAGKILMLENLRFHKEETDNDQNFAKQLAYLGDVYVNEAFSVCHRANASITGIPQILPNCAGLLLQKEVETLGKVMQNPAKPMVAIVGGTKVETKAKLIDNLLLLADFVLVSGLIAKEIKEKNIEFNFSEKIVVPSGQLDALDINDWSINIFQEKILAAKTIIWNGPFGRFEDKKYEKGTLAIAQAIIDSGAFSVVGGGETVEFLQKKGMIDKFSHVSTGGGAMLDYLSGEKLPGLEALENNKF